MRKIFCLVCIGIFMSGCGSRDAAPKKEEARDYIKEGTEFLAKGELQEAIKIFREAVTRNPNDTKAYFVLAQTYLHLKDYNNALDNFKTVTTLEPDNGEAYLLLGGCYDLLGKKDEAIQNVKKSVMIFEKKRDEASFKRSVAILRRLMGVNTMSVNN